MLIDEMHFRFQLGLDKVASQDRPDLTPNEIDNYLNRAIIEFVKSRYKEYLQTKRGFETDHDRISALMSLHVDSPVLQSALVPTNLNNGYYVLELNSLSFEFMYPTKLEVKIKKDNCPSKIIRHKAWQTDDLKTVYTEPSFNFGRVLVTYIKSSNTTTPSQIKFDTLNKRGVSQFEIEEVYVSYIKRPDRVCLGNYKHIDDTSGAVTTPQQSCDIHKDFHDEIVNEAVLMAAKDIQDQFTYQSSLQRTMTDK